MQLIKFTIRGLLAMSLLYLAACSDSDDNNNNAGYSSTYDTPEPIFSVDNTSDVILNGAPLGSDTIPIARLRKSIAFSITNPDPRFSFEDFYVTRDSTSSDYFSWMLYVTNVTSNETICFININNGVFRNNVGQELVVDTLSYVDGSVRKFTLSAVETNTCLLPGERGVFIGIDEAAGLFDAVTEVIFNYIDVNDTSETQPSAANVVHGGVYHTENVGEVYQVLRLPVSNFGAAAKMGILSRFLLVDANELPLDWGFFSVPSHWGGVLETGTQGMLEDFILIYSGTANRIQVFIDYEEATLPVVNSIISSSDLTTTSPLERKKQMLRQRNQMEVYKQTLVVK